MAHLISKYGKNPRYSVSFCLFVLLISSFSLYKYYEKSRSETFTLISLINKQRTKNHEFVNLLLEINEKNLKNKKNLQVFISEFNEYRSSNSQLNLSLKKISLLQDPISIRYANLIFFQQKQFENSFREIRQNQSLTSILNYLNYSGRFKFLVFNTHQSDYLSKIESKLIDENLDYENSSTIFFLITVLSFIVLLSILIYSILQPVRKKLKKVSLELDITRSDYNYLCQNIGSIFIKLTNDGVITHISSSCSEIIGYSCEEIIEKSIFGFMDEDATIKLRSYFTTPDFKSEFTFSSRFLHKANYYIWVEIRIKPLGLSSGEFSVFLTEITDKKKLENELIESQTKYRAVFDNMFDGFAYYKVLNDENGKTEDYILLEVNDAFERLTGLQRENVVGKRVTEIFPGIKESRYNWIGKYDNVAFNGEITKSIHYERQLEKWYNLSSYSPMKGYFVTLFEDITQRKNDEVAINHYISELQKTKEKIEYDAKELAQLNEKLCKSEAELKELNTNKDKFFSIIAHDLRTPFNSLIGLSDLLTSQVEQLTRDEIKEYSSNIYNSSSKLFNLLENLLKWAGVQSGRVTKTPVAFYIDALIISVADLYRNNLSDKEINLVLNLTKSIQVYADQDMIETVLRNLLSNAIKFTNKKGTITVEMKCNPIFVEIYISDSGVGIDQTVIDKLFKISEHITSPGTENEKGTGLGLILCKEFIEKNGGIIKVFSEPGKGSKFVFTIPR